MKIVNPRAARIVIFEDDRLLGDLMRLALERRLRPAQLQVFTTGQAGLDHCRADAPDLALVDLGLPDMDGREVVRRLRSSRPDARVIVVTGQIDPTLPGQLLALGVSGYVEKTSAFEQAHAAVVSVLAGGIYFTAGLRSGADSVPPATAVSLDEPARAALPENLSGREREICRMVAAGMISKEIGAQMQLSPRTIEKARSAVMHKLQVRDLPALVRWCMKHGLT